MGDDDDCSHRPVCAAAKRVFGDSEVSGKSGKMEDRERDFSTSLRSARNDNVHTMSYEERLEYDRRRAEMVRDVLAEGEIAGQAGNDEEGYKAMRTGATIAKSASGELSVKVCQVMSFIWLNRKDDEESDFVCGFIDCLCECGDSFIY